MISSWKPLLVTLLLGVVAAGPLAALALVAVPPGWRGPIVPAAVLVLVMLATTWLRHRSGGAPRVRETQDGRG